MGRGLGEESVASGSAPRGKARQALLHARRCIQAPPARLSPPACPCCHPLVSPPPGLTAASRSGLDSSSAAVMPRASRISAGGKGRMRLAAGRLAVGRRHARLRRRWAAPVSPASPSKACVQPTPKSLVGGGEHSGLREGSRGDRGDEPSGPQAGRATSEHVKRPCGPRGAPWLAPRRHRRPATALAAVQGTRRPTHLQRLVAESGGQASSLCKGGKGRGERTGDEPSGQLASRARNEASEQATKQGVPCGASEASRGKRLAANCRPTACHSRPMPNPPGRRPAAQ